MKSCVFYMVVMLAFISCSKSKSVISGDLNNKAGVIEIHRCFCATSAYRYLIVTYDGSKPVYFNPVNLAEDFKDKNYKIVFSAELLNDSSIVYTNLPNDALVEAFKARNIRLIDIEKTAD